LLHDPRKKRSARRRLKGATRLTRASSPISAARRISALRSPPWRERPTNLRELARSYPDDQQRSQPCDESCPKTCIEAGAFSVEVRRVTHPRHRSEWLRADQGKPVCASEAGILPQLDALRGSAPSRCGGITVSREPKTWRGRNLLRQIHPSGGPIRAAFSPNPRGGALWTPSAAQWTYSGLTSVEDG